MNKEEAIKELKERVTTLKRHIKLYEESDCKTNIYQQLIIEKQAIETVLAELEKKEKIIDAMADALKFSFNSGINFFPSSICKCEGDIRKCEGKICTECIIQYFEKKVGE